MADTKTTKPAVKKIPKGDKKQNPLDILEDLLDNAEAQKEETQAKVAEEQKKAEIAAAEAAAKQRDLELLEKERAQMSDIASTPQQQARLEQLQQKKEQREKAKEEGDGFEIVQLGHTKI